VASTLAGVLGVAESLIEVVSLREGSLVVVFRLLTTVVPASQIVSSMAAQSANYTQLMQYYQTTAVTGEQIAVSNVGPYVASPPAGAAGECQAGCVVAIILGTCGGILIFGVVGYCFKRGLAATTNTNTPLGVHEPNTPQRTSQVCGQLYQNVDSPTRPHFSIVVES
jgi:hypothetical protein